MKKYIICSIGLTAAGKTTTLRHLAKVCNVEFVSEGAIKRLLVNGEYNVTNSTDEVLRNNGYKIAIEKAFNALIYNNSVIIDASFHQLFRRLWVYDEIQKRNIENAVVIWVYCVCNNDAIVRNRIYKRFVDPVKNADNQANTYAVYEYTKRFFDEVNINDFNSSIPTQIIKIDTENNKILAIENSNEEIDFWDVDIENWRQLWESYM